MARSAAGFNLRNGGYFFDISDYVKLSLTGDIYSKGATRSTPCPITSSDTIQRQLQLAYSKNKIADNIESPVGVQ